jgi:cobalt-zinc-cadmium efflux system outer membrane protein
MLLLVLLPCLCHAQTATVALTMDEAVALAKQQNPTLLASRQNLYSVKALEIQAAVRQNPYFSAGASNITLPASNANPYAYSFGVGRLFERGDKRRWRVDAAKYTTAQTDAQYHDQERGIVLSVRQAFTNLVLAKSALKLADDNLKDYRHELEISNDRYQAGDIAKLDYERLDLQLAQYESDQANARQNLVQASDQLQTLVGYEKPRADFDVIGDLVPPAVTVALPDIEQQALDHRPDYQAAKFGVNVADANVKLAYANGTADPTAEADYDYSGGESSAGFSFNVPLRIFDRNQGNKQSSEFSAASSRLSEIASRNQVNSDVDQAWIVYTTSKGLSDRYNNHYLAEAKDVLDIAEFSYQHGGLALVDFLDALRDYRSTSSDALNAYAATWMAIHQVSYVAATDVVP